MGKQLFASKNDFLIQLGISLPTLNRRLADGSIHSVKLGGRVLIPISELDRLLGAANSEMEV